MQKCVSAINSSFPQPNAQTAQSAQSSPESKRPSLDVISLLGKDVSRGRFSAEKAVGAQFDLNQLPIELVEEIIVNATSNRDLYALCLVCKMFHEWLTPRLYESIFLPSAERIICFSNTLARKPALGRIVRDLCMFESVKRHKEVLEVTEEDEDSDDDSDWIPDADDDVDASNGSASDETDSEVETEISDTEVDDLHSIVHYPFGTSDYPRHSIMIHSHDTSPQPGPSTVLSPGCPNERQPMHAERRLWMESLSPIVTSESVVYAHACAVMGLCPSLRTLYLPWSGSPAATCLRALLPWTRLQELAVYKISDLGLAYKKLQSASILIDFSSIQRLTIFDTTFQTLSTELPDILPALTHLRISLNVSADMTACLSRFTRLTHLWFAPPQGDWHPQVDIEAFLLDVQTRCPRIKRVRVDFPLGSTDAPQSFGAANWELFPFVRIRGSVLRDTKNMWVYDLEYPFHDRPLGEDVSPYMYNAYAECLKHYWRLTWTGGGWDD